MNVAAVGQIGNHIGGMMRDESHTAIPAAAHSIHAGRGFSAPMSGKQVHRSGSQGRHK